MNMTCGIVEKGTFADPHYHEKKIKWNNVSPTFKAKFMADWEQFFNFINEDVGDVNPYINYLCVLDVLGYLINQREISSNTHYEDGYNLAKEKLFESIQ